MNVLKKFQFFLKLDTSCFQAEIQLDGHGVNQVLMLRFFDSEVKFGKYSGGPGVYVSFHHPSDYLAPLAGMWQECLWPQMMTSQYLEHWKIQCQKKYLEKAKCLKHGDPVWYNFTREQIWSLSFVCVYA